MNETDPNTRREPRKAGQVKRVPITRISSRYVMRIEVDEIIARKLVFFSSLILSVRVNWKA